MSDKERTFYDRRSLSIDEFLTDAYDECPRCAHKVNIAARTECPVCELSVRAGVTITWEEYK